MTERAGGQQASPLQSDRGTTTISDAVVQQVAGIAAQEVDQVQMGGATSQAVGGFLQSVTGGSGGSGNTRGVNVEVGQEEAAVDLSMAVEYGASIPQISEAVRRNVINRIESLLGLRVAEVNVTVNDVLIPNDQQEQGT